ncbi:hypothetical protein BMS3Abin15_00534 [bacterium BMS3Abin15]|nr:hypothetical protein BMS3Abin15_00534 [bacterium BMS3Abin15]HDH07623.1 hypothetical protein [Candidatus Moranbacteria bacterium]HDZ85060.1 hypothetical protein [Candidatus Moranbacteria bacterium]
MPQKEKWTIEKIKEGFEKFFEIHGRYPTAYDVDDFEFLPSARQIQRRFGGLIKLRKRLGLSIDNYSIGDNRSKIATQSNINARKYETEVLNILLEKFDEKFIHIERPVDTYNINYNSKSRYDFYVYAKPHNFAIDVVKTNDVRTLIKNINLKEKKYNKIDSKKFNNWNNRREGVGKMPTNWKIINESEFKEELNNYYNYKAI